MPTDLRSLSAKELRRRLAELRAGTDEKAPGASQPGTRPTGIAQIQRRMAINQNRTAGIGKQGLSTIREDPDSPEAVALRQRRAVALGLREAPGTQTSVNPRGATRGGPTGSASDAVTPRDPGFSRNDQAQHIRQLESEGGPRMGMAPERFSKPASPRLDEIKRRLRQTSRPDRFAEQKAKPRAGGLRY